MKSGSESQIRSELKNMSYPLKHRNKTKKMMMHDDGIKMTAARVLHIIIKKSSILSAHALIEMLKRAKDPER
jgi:hypothetical protein